MIVDVAQRDGVTVVRPLGERLDLEVASEFRGILSSLVKGGHRYLVIDLQDVAFIDSSGLGSLISALKQLKTSRDRRRERRPQPSRRPAARGDVKLANLQDPVASLLEIIRLDRVFSRHPSVDDAVESYRR